MTFFLFGMMTPQAQRTSRGCRWIRFGMMMIQDDDTTGSVTPDALQNDADTTEDDADAMRLTMMGFRIMASR